jgi:hypothetical protein
MPEPKRGVPYSFSRGLYDATTGGSFRVNPTIASGDFRLSKDNGPLVNLANLPAVAPAGSALVLFQLTAAEMTADRVTIVGTDQAGGEWAEFMEHIEPMTQSVTDLPTAEQVADTVLTRDWSLVGLTPPAYSVWNALRLLRNAWTLVAGNPGVLHVKTEDGATDAWVRSATTSANAHPVTGVQ